MACLFCLAMMISAQSASSSDLTQQLRDELKNAEPTLGGFKTSPLFVQYLNSRDKMVFRHNGTGGNNRPGWFQTEMKIIIPQHPDFGGGKERDHMKYRISHFAPAPVLCTKSAM